MANIQYPIMTMAGSLVIAENAHKQEVVAFAYVAGSGTIRAPTRQALSFGFTTT